LANEKEIWEIELDIKTAKVDQARQKYNESLEKIKTDERRLTVVMNNEGKLQTANELTNILERRKIRLAAIDAELNAEKTARLQAQKERERDAKLTGQTSSILNYGVTELKGQVGSAAYVSQLKAMRNELSPTSAEFKQLSATISQFETELNKVNKSSGLQNWKNLNTAIKETRGELARLTAEGKVGGAEWDKYSQKLRELQRQKQLVQRETKLTSQQLLAMSRDFTVVSFGVRQIITDIAGLSEGKKSAGELAVAISGIGLQTLTVLPAIHGLTKALQAAGLVSAATIAKLSALAGTLGTLSAGIVAVGSAMAIMIGHAVNLGKELGRITDVLSGQMSYWEAVALNIKDVTFGLIDFTDASNNFDSSNVQQQLNDLAYIANFTANVMADLKSKVDDAVNVNLEKFKEYARLNKLPESYAGPEISDQDRLNALEKSRKTNKGGKVRSSSGTTKEEKNAIDELIKSVNLELDIKRLLGQMNLKLLIDQKAILQAADSENLKLEDRKKLLEEIEKVQGRIATWLTAGTRGINETDALTIPYQRGNIGKKRFGTGYDPLNDPDNTAADIQALLDAELKKQEANLGYVNGMYSNFKGMLDATGLMKGEFAQIIGMIDTLINAGSSAFGFFDAIGGLLGFIPGGGAVSSVIGGLSGGGGGGNMPRIGSNPLVTPRQNVRNFTMPSKGIIFGGTVIVESQVEKAKSVNFYQGTLPDYTRRQEVKSLS